MWWIVIQILLNEELGKIIFNPWFKEKQKSKILLHNMVYNLCFSREQIDLGFGDFSFRNILSLILSVILVELL